MYVDPEYLLQLLKVTGPVFTVLQFLTGSQICYTYVGKGNTGDTTSVPFVAGALCCAVWCKYGALIRQPAMMLVNLVGTVLHVAYVFVFYAYTLRKTTVVKQSVFAFVFFFTTCAVLMGTPSAEGQRAVLGSLCAMMSVAFCAAPLASIGVVVQNRNCESLPFYFILVTFLVTAQWWMFGTLLGDGFVKYPNMVGCVLAAFQLSLFAMYPAEKKPKKTSSMQELI